MRNGRESSFSDYQGKQGGRQLLHKGFSYNIRKSTAEKIYWMCTIKKCPGKITTNSAISDLSKLTRHNHAPSQKANMGKNVRNSLIQSIETNPNQTSGTTVRNELSRVSSSNSSFLPGFSTLARTVRYHRSKHRPPLPESAEELILREPFTTTKVSNLEL